MTNKRKSLAGCDYDNQWRTPGDFIRFNPGARHRRRLILRMLRECKFTDVLDIGCGPGEVLLTLRQAYPGLNSYTGVDLAPETIALNRKRFPWAVFHVLDITRESLDLQRDLILCSEVFEHLSEQERWSP